MGCGVLKESIMFYYSKSTNGFYTKEIHGDNIPVDAVEITHEQHTELLQGQSNGKKITGSDTGLPILVDIAVEEPSGEIKKLMCKQKAKELLVKTDYTDLVSVTSLIENKAEFDEYRTTVRNLYLNPVENPVWPAEPTPIWKNSQ